MKEKPKSKCCNVPIKEETGWIEHDGIGHPGGIAGSCSKCGKKLNAMELQELIGYYYNKSNLP